MRIFLISVSLLLFSVAASSQLPAGTHSADDHSRENSINSQIAAAESALEKQDYKTAEEKLKGLAQQRPKDIRILYDLGFAQEANHEETDAAATYTAAIAAQPQFAEPKVALGLLEARSGHPEAAHQHLLEAAQLTTASPQLRSRALRALARLDETTHPADAREELIAAVKLTGENPDDIALGAALAEHAGDASDAETAYRRALQAQPDDIDAATGLAHVLQQQKKNVEAEAVLRSALNSNPGDPRLVSQLVPLYASTGRASDAAKLLEDLRAKDPQFAANPSSKRMLARTYAMADDNSQAFQLFSELSASSPDDPTVLDDLGSILIKLGRYSEAEAAFVRAVTMRPAFHGDAAWDDAEGHLAFAASKTGHPQLSLQALAARATVLPNSPSSLFLEAIAHDALKQTKEAIQAYRAFLAVAGGGLPDQEFQARHRLVALQHER